MGVFKKLKDVLFDIDEDELPVITKKEEPKKEKQKEEIKLPKYKEENTIKEIIIPKEEIYEREILTSDSTFNFPLDIDEAPATRSNRSFEVKKEQTRNVEPRNYNFDSDIGKDKKKVDFKPTPIISPVYGILDQNYSKDDIIVKTDIGVKTSLEEVRKKAYGIKPKNEKSKTDSIKTIDEILMEEEPDVLKVTERIKVELDDEPEALNKNDLNVEDTIETDLFNLIDSMYEDKKESEEQ